MKIDKVQQPDHNEPKQERKKSPKQGRKKKSQTIRTGERTHRTPHNMTKEIEKEKWINEENERQQALCIFMYLWTRYPTQIVDITNYTWAIEVSFHCISYKQANDLVTLITRDWGYTTCQTDITLRNILYISFTKKR